MFDHKSLILILYLRCVAMGGDLTMMSVFQYVTLSSLHFFSHLWSIFEIKTLLNTSEEDGLETNAEKSRYSSWPMNRV